MYMAMVWGQRDEGVQDGVLALTRVPWDACALCGGGTDLSEVSQNEEVTSMQTTQLSHFY